MSLSLKSSTKLLNTFVATKPILSHSELYVNGKSRIGLRAQYVIMTLGGARAITDDVLEFRKKY